MKGKEASICNLTSLIVGVVILVLLVISLNISQAVRYEKEVSVPNKLYEQIKSNINSIQSNEDYTQSILQKNIQSSKNAYVTLISGIDKTNKYKGFLYNALIMKKALTKLGSTADFIALLGFSDPDLTSFAEDINLLQSHHILVYFLPRLLNNTSEPLRFAEMALLKIIPWNLIQYNRIQYLDGDVMPTKNMDCFFSVTANTFTVGAASPLNSGWYIAIPNQQDYKTLLRYAQWRLNCDWDASYGWKDDISTYHFKYRGQEREVNLWNFNGADMDQGLFTYYFLISHGNALLIDTEIHHARSFKDGLSTQSAHTLPMKQVLSQCHGEIPTNFFAHFTGKSKPWVMETKMSLQDISMKRQRNYYYNEWIEYLDQLKLPINSSNLHLLNLGSPLGYYNVEMFKKSKGKCQVLSD